MRSFDADPEASDVAMQAHKQGFKASFNVCKFIMQACYLKAGEAIGPLIPRNASPNESVDFVSQRRKKLEEALELANSILPPSPKK